jgi:dienelactone hydrolase
MHDPPLPPATALHEAGHAVMGWALGRRFRAVSVRARPGAAGWVWFDAPLAPQGAPREAVETAALILLAGPTAAWPAERRFRARSAVEDLAHAYDLALRVSTSPRTARERYAAWRERAWNLLQDEALWRAVLALATALASRGTLPGSRARRLIEETAGLSPPAAPPR